MTETLIVAEEKKLVALDGTAQRGAEVVALELGNAGEVEIVAGIEEAVADELVNVTVKLVASGGRNDGDLGAVAAAGWR